MYPFPGAFRMHPDAEKLFYFLGKVVGKAIYEMMLLEPQFSRAFLNRVLQRDSDIEAFKDVLGPCAVRTWPVLIGTYIAACGRPEPRPNILFLFTQLLPFAPSSPLFSSFSHLFKV